MKSIEILPIWKDKISDFQKLKLYLTESLCNLQLSGAVAFGSAVRMERTSSKLSDIDIVAYSDQITRNQAEQWIDYIVSNSPEFYDKIPTFVEDYVTARIEFNLKLGETIFDISLFPAELCNYESRFTHAVRDRLEVVIGSLYVNAYLIFGDIPFEPLIQREFLPFYSDDLRQTRMMLLESRIRWNLEKLELSIQNGEDDLLEQIYKIRSYLIKWMFIQARKYPVDCNRYLRRQLEQILNTPSSVVDALLLKGPSLSQACHRFYVEALNILSSEHSEKRS